MADKSRILIIGATGYIGKFIAAASARAGHPTFALIRESTLSNPDKAKLVQEFKSSGIGLVLVIEFSSYSSCYPTLSLSIGL